MSKPMKVDKLLKEARKFIEENMSLYMFENIRTSFNNLPKLKRAEELYQTLSFSGNYLLRQGRSSQIRDITWACQLLNTIAHGKQFYKTIEFVKPVAVGKNGIDYVLATRMNEYSMDGAFDRRDSHLERVYDVLHVGHSFDNRDKWIYQSASHEIMRMLENPAKYRNYNPYKTVFWNGFEINEEGNFLARTLPGIPEHIGNSLSIIIQRSRDDERRIPATIPFYSGTAKEITLDAAGLERQIRDATDYIKMTISR